MWNNATSGFTFSIYLFVLLLTVLASGSDKVEAKRGCSIFGHSCFGGHGKRFDPLARRMLEASNNLPSRHSQESEIPSTNDGDDDNDDDLLFILPNDKLRERSERSFIPPRRDTRPFNSYRLSSLVDQWLATHRRPHRTDLEVTNK
ncbi:uncharacterized protein LOC116848815 [Odontomachus brunneus]|uniref:uncharacterized protein LOC116848815 n=1 Tax=Odontomachus brunneus TaxID=486640 RepID=UPI0013F1B689|nr:uncharacterized protein LOC116848815 [Odontomachus brunneus]